MIFVGILLIAVWLLTSYFALLIAQMMHSIDNREEPFSYGKAVPLVLLWPLAGLFFVFKDSYYMFMDHWRSN